MSFNKLETDEKLTLAALILLGCVIVAWAIGYIINVATLAQMPWDFTLMLVMRIVGIFVFPLGGILGYV